MIIGIDEALNRLQKSVAPDAPIHLGCSRGVDSKWQFSASATARGESVMRMGDTASQAVGLLLDKLAEVPPDDECARHDYESQLKR